MAQGGPQDGDQDQARGFAVAVILLLLLLFAIGRLQEEMSAFAGAVAYLHLYPVAMLVETLPSLRTAPFIGPAFFAKAEIAKLFLEQGNFAYMTAPQRMQVLNAAGLCALPIYLPFMLAVAFRGATFRPDMAYRNAYSLEQMMWAQSEHWLTSRGSRHVNPLKLPEVSAGALARAAAERQDKAGAAAASVGHLIHPAPEAIAPTAWQRALRPEEWLVAQGLCLDPKHIEAAKQKDWKYPDALLESRDTWEGLTLETLMEALAGQLRTPWRGFEAMRPCHKAVAAVMCQFYAYDIDGGNRLLNDLGAINDSLRGKPGMDAALQAEAVMMERLDGILQGREGRAMREIADRHAWLETAFPAMLTFARKDRGVLPAAAFLWMKAEDRRLWYILDNVGSEAVMIECAGAMSHFRAEHQIGKPIRRPAVYQAARALLEDYLDMTEARIAVRREREARGRSAGEVMDLALKGGKA